MTSYSWAEYHKMLGIEKPKKGRKRSTVKTARESVGESTLAMQLRVVKIQFEQEFRFHPKRKWKADFHLIGRKILIEVEGGIWSGGRHTRGKGYIGDMEKYNSATMMGYQVIRFSTEQVKTGSAIEQIEKMVGDLG